MMTAGIPRSDPIPSNCPLPTSAARRIRPVGPNLVKPSSQDRVHNSNSPFARFPVGCQRKMDFVARQVQGGTADGDHDGGGETGRAGASDSVAEKGTGGMLFVTELIVTESGAVTLLSKTGPWAVIETSCTPAWGGRGLSLSGSTTI